MGIYKTIIMRNAKMGLNVADLLTLTNFIIDTSLSPLEADVIHSYHFHNKRQCDIAREKGISCGYVSKILSRSHEKLLVRLKEVISCE